METKRPRPIPDLEPRKITLDEYLELTPEKLELIEGFLIDGREYPDERLDLLSLLLTNEGLLATLRLAPEERWREAMRQVSGD